MRGCLAPAVLEMAFLRSERQAKAVWQPGAGNRRHPPRSHPQCSLLLITHSLCRPLIPASSILASPVSLRADARQPAEPQQLSCRAPGCPPISAEPGGCASPLAQQRGPTLPPPLQQPQVFWWGDRRPLRALYSYCCFYFCWMIQFLSLPSFPSFISILIVLSSLLWQACVGKCKFPRLLFFYWKTFLLEKGENGSKTTAKP